MHDIVKQVHNIKVKTFLIVVIGLTLLTWISTLVFVDNYHFYEISDTSMLNQKQCLDNFLSTFRKHRVAVILFDNDILPELFQQRPKSWHKSDHPCKALCKYNPEEKNVITFAVKGSQKEGKVKVIINDLKELGFSVHLSLDTDPRLLSTSGTESLIPTYLWLAKNDHVIHVAFLHERLGTYLWIGPVRDSDWKETINALAPALTDGWQSMEKIGAKFPTHAQAFDVSHRFLGLPIEIDGHKLTVPYHITDFLAEYKMSHFIECDFRQAREYKSIHERKLTDEERTFKNNARQLIVRAKGVLDKLKVSFWLNGGTCLGWYRQCDIIPYSDDVNFGILIYDYSLKIVEAFHDAGLVLTHKLGKTADSVQLSFIGEENIKLDIVFFYNDHTNYWHGGTEIEGGHKFKYKYNRFKLCWTEFLQIKIKVPCDPKAFVERTYGKDWQNPIKVWNRNLHSSNSEPNGKWKEFERDTAIQFFEKNEGHDAGIESLRQILAEKEIDIPHKIDEELSKLHAAGKIQKHKELTAGRT